MYALPPRATRDEAVAPHRLCRLRARVGPLASRLSVPTTLGTGAISRAAVGDRARSLSATTIFLLASMTNVASPLVWLHNVIEN